MELIMPPRGHRAGEVYLVVRKEGRVPRGLWECIDTSVPGQPPLPCAPFKDYMDGEMDSLDDVKYLTWARDSQGIMRYYSVLHEGHWEHNVTFTRGQEVLLYDTGLPPKFLV